MSTNSAKSLVLAILLAGQTAATADDIWDVVVYGGASAAVTTAVQCKAMGKSAVIVCPDRHLGGLSSGGLGWTDSGNKNAIGGLSHGFYHRVWKHYQNPDAWKWEDQAKFGNRNQSPPGSTGDGAAMW
ncbi:MAG: FAD-dependent oxidoreductase, partial [Fuerstiella sp.]